MRRTKYKTTLCCIMPDGGIVEISATEDVLGEANTTYSLPEAEREKLRGELAQGVGKRVSGYYDADGNFVG